MPHGNELIKITTPIKYRFWILIKMLYIINNKTHVSLININSFRLKFLLFIRFHVVKLLSEIMRTNKNTIGIRGNKTKIGMVNTNDDITMAYYIFNNGAIKLTRQAEQPM